MNKKIELLAPAGSMANLKAAVSKKADAVYLGMNKFSARNFATNFNEKYLKEAIKICKSNNVKTYLAMNTLVKNYEINDFFKQLSCAYSAGIDSVIIQETSFLDIIKKNYPDLQIHISTQAGVMNSSHANLLKQADRITLARELTEEEIKNIRKNYSKEIEIFGHGALCVSLSGSCLFSSLLGGRSGNRGRCAQPCRKLYNDCYYLSTRDLSLINQIPEIISLGIDSLKIEGRMRTPHYVATITEVYRKAIDSYYNGKFTVTKQMEKQLHDTFNREFTSGWFNKSKDIFNRTEGSGRTLSKLKETYNVLTKNIKINRTKPYFKLLEYQHIKSKSKNLYVKVYSMNDALAAEKAGADIVYLDLLNSDFKETKSKIKTKLFAVTPRIMLDSDIPNIKQLIKEISPDGILAGNIGMLNLNLNLPIHLDYNSNIFNDIDINNVLKKATPIISPELSIKELKRLNNKNFIVFVHGKIRLMTLRHNLQTGFIQDKTTAKFKINKIHNGSEILNEKELGLLNKSSQLINEGINNFFIDTDQNVEKIVKMYRSVLEGKKINDKKIRKKYVLGWSYRGIY